MWDVRGSSGCKSAPPEAADAIGFDTVAQDAPAAGALGLQGGLERVDGSQEHAEGSGACGGEDSLDGGGQLF